MTYLPPRKPRKGTTFDVYLPLIDFATDDWYIAPPVATGDVQISKDGGAFVNVTNAPVETPANSGVLKISLTTTETQADVLVVRAVDQTDPKAWRDTGTVLYPV